MERDYRKDYEELISKLKTILDSQTNETISIDSIRKVIPELSESKDNIENRLINAIKSSAQLENCLQKHGFKIKEILNWLEKQIERKSDVRYRYLEELLVADDIYQMAMNDAMVKEAKDKATSAISKLCVSELLGFRKTDNSVRPKFKTGDWVMLDRPVLITKVEDMPYNTHQYWTSDGKWFGDATKAKLWTIQDAKDGDVLAEHETIVLFKKIEGQNIRCYCTYHYLGFNPTFYVGTLQNKTPYCPATKEQRDLLLQKMKETGYEWDAEKKELRTIEQASAWNEEDEKILKELVEEVKDQLDSVPSPDCMDKEDEKVLKQLNKWMDWLKSLKDRIQPQPKQEWSEEDEKILSSIINDSIDTINSNHIFDDNQLDWLHSIKDRIKAHPQQKYSEEDDYNICWLIEFLQSSCFNQHPNIIKCEKWLKSLKDKIQPKQEWSEEDEKIRKELHKYFRDLQLSSDREFSPSTSINEILAWLEKQGEEKPVISDDALREGIAHFGITQYQIDNWLKKYVDVEKQAEQNPIDKVEPKFKVGDIISDDVSEVEIVSIDENKYNVTNSEIENDANICNWVVYFKDQEKWKLVEYKSYSEKNKKHLQSKQDWSEEDEKIINDAIWLIEHYATDGHKKLLREQTIDKLKSLKPNHWKPSEQNIKDLEWCADLVKDKMGVGFHRLQVFIDEIKNL